MNFRMKRRFIYLTTLFFFTISILFIGKLSYAFSNNEKNEKLSKVKNFIRHDIFDKLVSNNKLPKIITTDEEEFNVSYSLDKDLQAFLGKILRRYPSLYSAITIIDNRSGAILGMKARDRVKRATNLYTPMIYTHPAASLMKIITASAAIDSNKLKRTDTLTYNGKRSTLYKVQLKNKRNKWTRKVTLEKAFANSNNVIFGKIGINILGNDLLFKKAQNFGFNEGGLLQNINDEGGVYSKAKNEFNLAELSSGFNKETSLTPLHAAVLSSVIANNGILKYPHLISSVESSIGHKEIIRSKNKYKTVISKQSAKQMKEMMKRVVRSGTGRTAFRKISKKLKSLYDFGGKTGTITGGWPYGKNDWFTGFAIPKSKNKKSGISIAVLIVNDDLWYIKASEMAKMIMEFYLKRKM